MWKVSFTDDTSEDKKLENNENKLARARLELRVDLLFAQLNLITAFLAKYNFTEKEQQNYQDQIDTSVDKLVNLKKQLINDESDNANELDDFFDGKQLNQYPRSFLFNAIKDPQNKKPNHLINIVIIGARRGAGVTSIINRYIDDSFNQPSNQKFEFKDKKVALQRRVVQLRIWDSPEEGNLNKADITMLVIDISDRGSFAKLSSGELAKLVEKVKNFSGIKVIVFSKSDSFYDALTSGQQKILDENNCMSATVSAKKGTHIDELFHRVVIEKLLAINAITNQETHKPERCLMM